MSDDLDPQAPGEEDTDDEVMEDEVEALEDFIPEEEKDMM